MIVNIINIIIVKRKKTITEFFNDKFTKNFIITTYKFLRKIQFILVRLLDLNPEPPGP